MNRPELARFHGRPARLAPESLVLSYYAAPAPSRQKMRARNKMSARYGGWSQRRWPLVVRVSHRRVLRYSSAAGRRLQDRLRYTMAQAPQEGLLARETNARPHTTRDLISCDPPGPEISSVFGSLEKSRTERAYCILYMIQASIGAPSGANDGSFQNLPSESAVREQVACLLVCERKRKSEGWTADPGPEH